MEVTVQVSDEIVRQLGDVVQMPQQVIEAFAVENYRLEKLSHYQVSQLVDLDYWETEELLAKHGAKRPYTLEDLEADRKSLAQLYEK